MSTQTITEFLEARIAEDEADARERPIDAHIHQSGCYYYDYSLDSGWFCDCDEDGKATARVLAECAAKRAIIEQHKGWPVLVEKKPEFTEDTTNPQSMAYRVTQEMVWLTEREYVKRFGVEAPTTNMILALASVYKDHPDYRQEWAR